MYIPFHNWIFFLKIEPQKFVNDIHFNFFWATNIVTSLDKMPFVKIWVGFTLHLITKLVGFYECAPSRSCLTLWLFCSCLSLQIVGNLVLNNSNIDLTQVIRWFNLTTGFFFFFLNEIVSALFFFNNLIKSLYDAKLHWLKLAKQFDKLVGTR